MKLSEEQRQSLITSLLGFVRRVSFHGADSPEETEAFSTIACLLLGCPIWWSSGEEISALDLCEDGAEADELQKTENSGQCFSREYRCVADWRHKHGCPSLPKKDIRFFEGA